MQGAQARPEILIVDDRPENLIALKQTLAEVEATVVKAGSGDEALRACLSHDFALAILDVKMPRMDGYELASLLRSDPATAQLPIIFLTAGFAEESEVTRGYQVGAADYIIKPINPTVLLGKVSVFLQLDNQRREILRHQEQLEELVKKRTADLEQVNQQLRESEAELAQAQWIAQLGHWDYDVASDRPHWSETMFQIFGRDPALGEPSWADHQPMIHPEDWPILDQAVKRAVAQAEPYDIEFRILHPEGLHWGWSKCAVHKDPAGNVTRLSGITQDITERQRAAAETRTLLRTTQAVVDEADFAIAARIIFDTCRSLLGASAGYVALLREDEQELEPLWLETGALFREGAQRSSFPLHGLHAEVYQRGRAIYKNDFAAGDSPRPADHPPLKNMLISPMNVEGKTVGLFCLANTPSCFSERDRALAEAIGETLAMALQRSQARQALEVSEARYRLLAENASDVIWTTDLDLRFTYVSPSRDLPGAFPASQLRGETPEQIMTPPSWRAVKESLSDAVREAQEVGRGEDIHRVLELEMVRPDGSTYWVETKAKLLYGTDGQPVGVLGVNRDITERRTAEQEREALMASVAQSDRLANMGMLAAGVAHEINNPLSYVLYNLDSLNEDMPALAESLNRCRELLRAHEIETDSLSGKTDQGPLLVDDIAERFADALTGARRIKEIVRGLGTFSRVEQDKLVPVDVRYAMECACNMAFNEIKYRARLVKDFDVVPAILASEGRLSQVFLNLLINAAHAIDEGDVEKNAIRTHIRHEGDEVCIVVSDTGKGIAAEHLEHIFEPFFTTKAVGVGSGLGLAISKNIICSYGGRIEVQSEVGKGTTFTIRLPTGPQDVCQAGTEEPDDAQPPTLQGRVLVIDDEAGIRAAIRRLLSDHVVVEAASGAEGRAILERDQSFDLVLCDMMMPALSGMDLHQWLAEAYPAQAERLVFITGGAFTPRARKYLTKVDNLRVEKPLDPTNFRKMVAALISAHRATQN